MNSKIRFGLIWVALVCCLLLACGVSALAEGENGLSTEETTEYTVKWVDEKAKKPEVDSYKVAENGEMTRIPENPSTKYDEEKQYLQSPD